MIHTATFPSPAAVAEWFNAPANAALRLVSVLPPSPGHAPAYLAMYEERDPVEEARRDTLEERVLSMVQLDDDQKRKRNFPESILAELLVPLSIVSNKLGQLATFRELDNAARARWIRENAPAVGCAYISAEEARAHHGCAAELLRIEA